MKVLLTGITGNLGHEVALELNRRGIIIIPIIRSSKKYFLRPNEILFEDIIENNLTDEKEIIFSGYADCIVHCAGNVHFLDAGNSNQKMMTKVTCLAKKQQIPLYHVSTAYIYRPPGASGPFNNSYESDKSRCEQILISSGIEYAIFRPSVLVGNSKTGKIQNFSGFYSIVKEFYRALISSKQIGKDLRFPNLEGKANLVPVDHAAYLIANEIQKENPASIYITNPYPPNFSWLLKEMLDFFNLKPYIKLSDITFENFGKIELTDDEKKLYEFIKHYYPYLSLTYEFPKSMSKQNLINHDFLQRSLKFLNQSGYLNHG